MAVDWIQIFCGFLLSFLIGEFDRTRIFLIEEGLFFFFKEGEMFNMKEREELLLAMVNIPKAIMPQGIGMSQQTST